MRGRRTVEKVPVAAEQGINCVDMMGFGVRRDRFPSFSAKWVNRT
jgi:hypothetical protein